MLQNRHLFLLGPSGVGKTTLGDHLHSKGTLLHLNIDQYPSANTDGIDVYELRTVWDRYFAESDATKLAAALTARAVGAGRTGCVLTFGSMLVLAAGQVRGAEAFSIRVRYLGGPKERCLQSFLDRETALNRGLGREHWLANNDGVLRALDEPTNRPWIVDAFAADGSRFSVEHLASKVV